MLPSNPRQGKVKANPKMHKQDNPIRPIVSSISHPTAKLAEVAESELNERVESLELYIKDTTHFLHIIDNELKTFPQKASLHDHAWCTCTPHQMQYKVLYSHDVFSNVTKFNAVDLIKNLKGEGGLHSCLII